MLKPPPRGFTQSEFANRLARAKQLMREQEVDVMLFTTEANVRYFTGFFTQFWQSPTRPWFVLVALTKERPIAIIPEIGLSGMQTTWVEDIRTWSAPQPDDDGISLLTTAIKEHTKRFKRLGVCLGHESHLRMPAANFQMLKQNLSGVEIVDVQNLMLQLRNIKSSQEIAKIHFVCDVVSEAFERLPTMIKTGENEREICQKFHISLLELGADNAPYIVSGSGQGGYDSIIMGPTERVLNQGDVLIIDTGTTFDGYFSDFDRNFSFGKPTDALKRAYDTVYQATDAGFKAAKPGATTSDVYHAMWNVLAKGGALGNDVGRLGHGLGMELTEGMSNTASDQTKLEVGMVLTLEPGMTFAPAKQMVHEENIVITENGAEMLSRRAPAEMPTIE